MIVGNRKWIEISLERNSYFFVWGIDIWLLNSYRLLLGKYHYRHTSGYHEEFVKKNFNESDAKEILGKE